MRLEIHNMHLQDAYYGCSAETDFSPKNSISSPGIFITEFFRLASRVRETHILISEMHNMDLEMHNMDLDPSKNRVRRDFCPRRDAYFEQFALLMKLPS